MTRLRVAEKYSGHALPHVHVERHDRVVHIVQFTEGPSTVALDSRGAPTHDEFRMLLHCGQSVKMYFGGNNRITKAAPTCVRCIHKGG